MLLFYNGWLPHTTEKVADPGVRVASSLNGVFYFPDMVESLFGPAAMARRCGGGGGDGGEGAAATAGSGCRIGASMADLCGADIAALNPGIPVLSWDDAPADSRPNRKPRKKKA